MKKNILWIISFVIFIILYILFCFYVHDKAYFRNPEEYDFAFQSGMFFCFLMEGLIFSFHDLFIKRIFKKKDPT